MSTASFKVRGRLGFAGGEREGTVYINRDTGAVTVRPKGSRTTYEMPLSQVANFVCEKGYQNRPTSGSEEG